MNDGIVKAKSWSLWSLLPIFREEHCKEGAYLRDQIAMTDRGLMSHDERLCHLEKQVRILQEELTQAKAR